VHKQTTEGVILTPLGISSVKRYLTRYGSVGSASSLTSAFINEFAMKLQGRDAHDHGNPRASNESEADVFVFPYSFPYHMQLE